MKKFIIALVIACSSTFANADDRDYCEVIGNMAKNIMSIRQSGMSAMDLYEEMGGYSEVSEVARMMIDEAYSYSRYMGDEFQSRVISEFSSEWFMACLRADFSE